jgi:transglutaminase-like putative cysteine protease
VGRYARALAEIDALIGEQQARAGIGGSELRAIGPDVRMSVKKSWDTAMADSVRTVLVKVRQAIDLEVHAQRALAATAAHIKRHRLASAIQQRHKQAATEFTARSQRLKRAVAALELAQARKDAGKAGAAMNDLAQLIALPAVKRPATLPWGPGQARQAIIDVHEVRRLVLREPPVLLAAAGSLSGIELPAHVLPDTPGADDIAPTQDAPLTPEIRQLARDLGNSPVRIYNWVRHNIEFVPGYGAMQDAQVTLGSRRGNAFDSASLLVALLRAAGIPARYVYGTIELPAERCRTGSRRMRTLRAGC